MNPDSINIANPFKYQGRQLQFRRSNSLTAAKLHKKKRSTKVCTNVVAQNDCGANIAEVGFAMNHSHRHTVTRGYIKIDFSPAWELNKKVIDFIFFSNAKSKQGEAKNLNCPKDKLFRLSPKAMIYARAYFRGEVLAY